MFFTIKKQSLDDPKYYLLGAILGTIGSLICIYDFFDFIKTNGILKNTLRTIFTLWMSGYAIYFWMRYTKERSKCNVGGNA